MKQSMMATHDSTEKHDVIEKHEQTDASTKVCRPRVYFQAQEMLTPLEPTALARLKYHLHTIWLFTESDLYTFVVPNTAFGIFGALAGHLMGTGASSTAAAVLRRLPLIFVFSWTNLFVFDLANQRMPDSAAEDRLNKPRRPIPAGRISCEQTRVLTLAAAPVVLALNLALGVGRETALLFAGNWLYNDLKGGDGMLRNPLLAYEFAVYNHAALMLGMGPQAQVTKSGYLWIGIISAVILTTMEVQDLKDQAGDREKGRRTLPLVIGESATRWIVAVFILGWSGYCTLFWRLSLWAGALPMALGGHIAWRALFTKGTDQDKVTWKMWCMWTAVLYALPVLSMY